MRRGGHCYGRPAVIIALAKRQKACLNVLYIGIAMEVGSELLEHLFSFGLDVVRISFLLPHSAVLLDQLSLYAGTVRRSVTRVTLAAIGRSAIITMAAMRSPVLEMYPNHP